MPDTTATPVKAFDVDAARALIEDRLQYYTRFDVDCPVHLAEAIRYSLLGSGKRLRPLLVLMAADACGADFERAMPAACAVEMIHTYSLIHDDLPSMDDDSLRRGLPALHIQYDEATAILAGDALIPLAFQVVCSEFPPSIAAPCCLALATACGASRLVGGQVDDLAHEREPKGDLEELERIHHRKTGALLAVSLEMGAIIAGGSEVQKRALREFGTHLGLAFQIVDDLLDCRGDWTKMGKLAGKDHDRGKLTYPGLLGVEPSQQRAEQLIQAAIDAIACLGTRAESLKSLARYVLERNQ
jgi:geranylgeranyl diphosphate synthase type II